MVSTTKAISLIGELVKKVFSGQKVRNDIIEKANQLATALSTASGFVVSRLNEALMAKTKDERIMIISKLTSHEIESFSRMNGHCAVIYSASNALLRWTSDEAVNVRMTSKKKALEVLNELQNAESGMQTLFNDLLGAPANLKDMADSKIREWIKGALKRSLDLADAANSNVRQLAKLI